MQLQEWLESNHSLGERIDVVSAIARGLAKAHAGGSCHGDAVAPDSISLLPGGQVHFVGGTTGLSESPYQSPERAKGAPPSRQTDVFSAGVIFYQVLSGEHPFAGESLTGLLVADFRIQPTHLRQRRREIPGELADAIMACIEKDSKGRPKDLGAVLEGLRRASTSVAAAPPPPEPPRPRPSPAPALLQLAQRPASGGGSGKFVGMALGAVVVLGAAAGWYFLKGEKRPPAPQPKPAVASATVPEPAPPEPTAPESAPNPRPAAAPQPSATLAAMPQPSATPVVMPIPESMPVATPTPQPTPTPLPPSRAATPTPFAEPARAPSPPPTPAPTPAPAGPVALTHLSPPSLQRRPNVLLDIRGNGMRLDHTAVILKQGRPAPGITIARQKYAGPEVIQLLLKLAPNVPTGDYTVVLVDASGATSNAVPLKIER